MHARAHLRVLDHMSTGAVPAAATAATTAATRASASAATAKGRPIFFFSLCGCLRRVCGRVRRPSGRRADATRPDPTRRKILARAGPARPERALALVAARCCMHWPCPWDAAAVRAGPLTLATARLPRPGPAAGE